MKVEIPVIELIRGTSDYAITKRVLVTCKAVGDHPDGRKIVHLLEAGAGLAAGAEVMVPPEKVSDL